MGGDLAPNFGGTKKFFAAQFQEKFPFSGYKFLMTFFFSHRPGSSDFSFLFLHFPYVYYVKCRIYDHFLTRKTQFSLCLCFHGHPTTLLLKILGGTNAWAVPPTSTFGGDRPPQSPPRSPPLTKYHTAIAVRQESLKPFV